MTNFAFISSVTINEFRGQSIENILILIVFFIGCFIFFIGTFKIIMMIKNKIHKILSKDIQIKP